MGSHPNYQGVTAAVFGASGFIGQWVARALRDAGATVVLVVRHANSLSPVLRTASATVVEADLTQQAALCDLLADVRPAIVFNLAGYGVDRSERDEQLAITINTDLPRWIAEALAAYHEGRWTGQRLIHVGSALEYGEIGGDLSETSQPNPTTLYGRTKLAGTLALQHACTTHGVRGLTARLFTVYGAGEHAGRLLPTLLEARTHNGAIPMSAGLQRRDFTYVEDVAEGLRRLGRSTATPGEIINLATGRLTSVREFATEAARELGIARDRLDFGALPTRDEEMQHDPVSVARLRDVLGWVPSTSIAEGVRRATQGTRA